jgi:hypothetical protein
MMQLCVCEQINEISIKFPQLCTNDKKFIADAAHDSLKIKNLLIENLLIEKN